MSLAKRVIEGNYDIAEHEVHYLLDRLSSNYELEPNVVRFPSEDVLFVGDLHGDLQAAEGVVEKFNELEPAAIVFLGDYADRGADQIETTNLIMSLAAEYPQRVILLRGNHEEEELAARYGFKDIIRRRYSLDLFRSYCNLFKSLPIAAMNDQGVFACHGGVPEGVSSLSDLQKPNRHHENIHNQVLFQLVWNDPKPADFYFQPSMRGGGAKNFGRKAFDDFADSLSVNIMIRAHQAFPSGFRRFFEGKLISIFSTAYKGRVDPRLAHLTANTTIKPVSHM